MSDGDKCVTLEEVDFLLQKRINGGFKRQSNGDWVKVAALCVTVVVVSVGAMRYILKSEIHKASSSVKAQISLHENLPWHPPAGEAHSQTAKHLADIDQTLTRQTTILERVERAIERQ